MPLYQYQCNTESCGHKFDEVKRIADRLTPTENPCPKCNNNTIQLAVVSPRIVSGVGSNPLNKTPEAFKDHLREMKKAAGRTSTIEV